VVAITLQKTTVTEIEELEIAFEWPLLQKEKIATQEDSGAPRSTIESLDACFLSCQEEGKGSK
jgi:ABC-type thiamine transport system ATPase subunit